MKKDKTFVIMILVMLIVSSCEKSIIDAASTAPAHENLVIASPSISPPISIPSPTTQNTSTPSLEPPKIQAGVYLVYRKGTAIYAVNDLGEFPLLNEIPEDSLISASPNGLTFTYMNKGALYAQNISNHIVEIVPVPPHSIDTNQWLGSWSQDGRYLAYAINMVYAENQTPQIQEFSSIYISDLLRNTFSQVTLGKGVETYPSWSPDNQWILFAADSSKLDLNGSFFGATDIFVMSTKCVSKIETCRGYYARQLTYTETRGDAINPAWNPTDSEIGFIYINGQTGDKDICLVDLNGKVTNLTNTNSEFEDTFDWSPNGNEIVFRRYGPGIGTDLFIYNVSDASIIRITNTPNIAEGVPVWSPDGNMIAFQQNSEDSSSGIMIYSVNDSKSQILKNSSGNKFLFWVSVFPEISIGAILTVSPSGQGLNIRSEASIDSPILGKLVSGDKIEVLSAPVIGDSYSWWNIKSETGEGWVVQLYNWYLP